MQEMISAAMMFIGAAFFLISGLGVIRFPDLYMRVSASTKASTLGAGFSLLSLAIYFGELGITMRSLATITFLVVTAPVAAHLISRAAYSIGVRLWEGTISDELRGKYAKETGALQGLQFDGALETHEEDNT